MAAGKAKMPTEVGRTGLCSEDLSDLLSKAPRLAVVTFTRFSGLGDLASSLQANANLARVQINRQA